MKTSKFALHDKFSLVISNMKVSGIPTQTSRVFLGLKLYHTKKNTNPVQITDNSVEWDEEINMKCSIPKVIKKAKPKFFLHISIRFESPSGRGFVQYGSVDIDVSILKTTQEIHINLPVQYCIENSNFSCDITNENPLTECTELNNSRFPTSIAVNENSSTAHKSIPSSFSMTTNSADQSVNESSLYTEYSTNHSISNQDLNTEVKVTIFDNIDVNIKEPKLKELENLVDYIVAQIINNSY